MRTENIERNKLELMEVLKEMRKQEEHLSQIDAICEYLGVELVQTKSGRWKCINKEKKK